MAKFYVMLKKGGIDPDSGEQWSLPTRNSDGTWTPGEWMPVRSGESARLYSVYELKDILRDWACTELYEIEYKGDLIRNVLAGTWRAGELRLRQRVEEWNERNLRLFACDCAEHVLRLLAQVNPDEKRPYHAIIVDPVVKTTGKDFLR